LERLEAEAGPVTLSGYSVSLITAAVNKGECAMITRRAMPGIHGGEI